MELVQTPQSESLHSVPESASLTVNPAPLLISMSIHSLASLQRAYVPIIEGGGLFIPTDAARAIRHPQPRLGERLFLMLQITTMDFHDAFVARIVWINPPQSAPTSAEAGFAIQLLETGKRLRTLLENHLHSAPAEVHAPFIF